MKITELRTINGSPYKSITDLCEEFRFSRRTISERIKEIEQETDRYGEYAVIRVGGRTITNYLAFIDYMRYHDALREKNLRKNVPTYNPQELAKAIGWYGLTE